jgi:hypothetical protein
MSVFDQIAEVHSDDLLEHFGDPDSITVNRTTGAPFTVDAILGTISGAELFNDVDQTSKLLTAQVHVRRSDLAIKGITEMPMMAKVNAYGLTNWAIDLANSEWGAVWVKIGLKRETLAREFQARRNAAV